MISGAAAVSVRLELPDAAGEHPPVEAPPNRVDVLEPVEQRQRDRATRLDATERLVEAGRLDRDEQQVDGLVQLLDGTGAHRPDVGALSQGQSLGRDRSGRGRAGNAHDVQAGLGKRDGERGTDGPGSQDADGVRRRHVSTHGQVSDTVP